MVNYKLRAIKSVKTSSNLSTRRMKCVTVLTLVHALNKKRNGSSTASSSRKVTNNGIPTTTAGGLWAAY